MRHEARTFSLSWIPSEAVEGVNKAVFETGLGHYDNVPPDEFGSYAELEARSSDDIFRFVNYLTGWIESDGEKITDYGYSDDSQVIMGSTTVKVPGLSMTLPAPSMPTIQADVVVTDKYVEFRQTGGGRTAFPMPRAVSRPPFVQIQAPLVWTTLLLRLFANGDSEHELIGASQFPRHWIYNNAGELSNKAGTADFKKWAKRSFGRETPWKGHDNEVAVTEAETKLERELSKTVMHSEIDPEIKMFKKNEILMKQGDPGDSIMLILDGIVDVLVNDHDVAQLGPGTIIGERALLEGTRTSSVVANTRVRVAETPGFAVDIEALKELSTHHHKEDEEVTAEA
jgi:hypothetical protein